MKVVAKMAIGVWCLWMFTGNVGVCEESSTSTADTAPLSRSSAESIESIKAIARQKVREGDFDGAIAAVESSLQQHPYNFDLEVALAKALLAQSSHAKAMNSEYKELVKRPYQMGKRMYKADPYRPDPYFIVAKSMLIVGQPQRAGKTIQKALYFARGQHPDIALYYEVLGDSWQEIKGDARAYARAKAAYQGALYGAGTDSVLIDRLEKKLKRLDKRFGYTE